MGDITGGGDRTEIDFEECFSVLRYFIPFVFCFVFRYILNVFSYSNLLSMQVFLVHFK